MPNKKIWEKDTLYRIARHYVDLCTRLSYRSISTSGSLPSDAAVLIAPNHTGTLMDALVVLQSRRAGTAFGARADIFRKERVARILRWLKIVPIVRIRDGLREVERNRETMVEIDDILAHGMPFCMFPEGRHRPMHSLLPLQKGIARIAFASAAKRRTLLVPAGIEYDDFFHYRPACTLRYGEPIDVGAFMEAHAGHVEAEQYKLLLDELATRIKGLILYIPDDEHYEAALQEALQGRGGLGLGSSGRDGRGQGNVECGGLGSGRGDVGRDGRGQGCWWCGCVRRDGRGQGGWWCGGVRRGWWWRWPLALVSFPLWLAAAVLALPLWAPAEAMCHFKIQDAAFRNTVRFAFRLLGMPVLVLLWAIPAFIFLPCWIAALLLIGVLFSYSLFYDWLNLVRR